MRKTIYVILVTLLIALPCLHGQDTDRELARTQEYIGAATKQGQAKINALKAYVKKFPDKSKKWTKLAYYQLAVEHFQLKKYATAVQYADQCLKMGAPGPGEEGRLHLIIANAYGVKSASIFNQETAVKKVNKAISFAKAKKLNDVLAQAKKLKGKLTGPKKPKLTPEQKMKMLYSEEDYSGAIAHYRTLGAGDKANPEIHKLYANSLFKSRKFDSALKEYMALYGKEKKAQFAARIADINARKGRRNKALLDKAVDYYLEASLLYKKEGNNSNSRAAYGKAEYNLFEKYGYNAKIKAYNRKVQRQQSSAKKNTEAIAKKKREIKKQSRHMERTYTRNDLAAPQFERDKLAKLQKQLRALESGAPAGGDDEGDKLKEEHNRIKKELKDRLAAAKKRLGL
jgi:tetratricopeptide (TPR) repeat protein